MNTSYKRYWEPSTATVATLSLGVNALAATVCYPIEFIKTRIQLRSEGIGIRQRNLQAGYNPWGVFRQIHESGVGLRGLYQGFDSHIMGRMAYLFIRNMVYQVIYDANQPVQAHNDLTTREKASIAAFAGGLAAFITTPFDLINIRQIAERTLPQNARRGYRGFADAHSKIVSTEGGNNGLFRGGLANVIRAVVLNVSLTGPYDYVKEKCYITFGDIAFNGWFALAWASFWSNLVVLPFDNARTRLMNQFPDRKLNRINYKGYLDVFSKSLQYEGFSSLYAGFTASYIKTFTYCALTVYTLDYFTSKSKRSAGLQEWQI